MNYKSKYNTLFAASFTLIVSFLNPALPTLFRYSPSAYFSLWRWVIIVSSTNQLSLRNLRVHGMSVPIQIISVHTRLHDILAWMLATKARQRFMHVFISYHFYVRHVRGHVWNSTCVHALMRLSVWPHLNLAFKHEHIIGNPEQIQLTNLLSLLCEFDLLL